MKYFTRKSLGLLALTVTVAGTGCASHQANLSREVQTSSSQTAMTPGRALQFLKEGNARFVNGQLTARDWAQLRTETSKGQYPHSVVLSCLDSRASTELIFDQGLGDVFSARVAGNILNDDILGSMEFACKAAGAKLIAVIAHTKCGAIKGACGQVQLGHLTGLLAKVGPAITRATETEKGLDRTDPKFIEKVAVLNVQGTMTEIRERSPILREMIEKGHVALVGGIYHLDTGEVEFLPN